MKTQKQQQILFFIDGPIPSEEDRAAAKVLGATAFRNARKYGTPPKDGCKAAGCVPDNYRKAKHVTIVALPQAQQPSQQSRK
jgi:hypothetical protein